MGLWNVTGNQMVEKRNEFLKDCAIYGTDITYIERVNTPGDFDPVTDTYANGTVEEKPTAFPKGILLVPVRASNADGILDNTNSTSMSVGFAMGFKFEGIDLRVHIFAKVQPQIPLTPTGIYEINGVRYRIKEVLHNQAFSGALPIWNVVRFEKA